MRRRCRTPQRHLAQATVCAANLGTKALSFHLWLLHDFEIYAFALAAAHVNRDLFGGRDGKAVLIYAEEEKKRDKIEDFLPKN